MLPARGIHSAPGLRSMHLRMLTTNGLCKVSVRAECLNEHYDSNLLISAKLLLAALFSADLITSEDQTELR